MNRYLKYLPKRYHNSIYDFYKDSEGWWIVLKESGEYILDESYGARFVTHEDTLKEALSEFRNNVMEK